MNTNTNTSLTPGQEAVYAALKKLVSHYNPAPTGGFDADDISLHCHLPSQEVQEHLHELETHRHVTAIEAPMGSAWDTHYTLPADDAE